MKGLQALSMYVLLIQKYMEFRGGISFCIEDFKNGTPAELRISEKDENGKVEKNYLLYGKTEENILSLEDEEGTDVILAYQNELKLSDKEKELQNLEFSKIIKENS